MYTALTKKTPFDWERWLKKRLAKSGGFFLTKACLAGLSWGYKAAVAIRHLAYDLKLLPIKRVRVPVVSVGALVCGGTRKTPLTAHLAEMIGAPVGILTSGYAAKIQDSQKRVCSALQGDEAFLLSLKLPFAKVYAHSQRIVSARIAEKEGVAYILMDSGLQHRALHRDIEIITIDAKSPFGEGRFLPRGFLRDFPSRLKAADWIVIMDSESEMEFETLTQELRKIHPFAKFVGMRGAFAKPEVIKRKQIGMFCGIAAPESFEKMLKRQGCEIVNQKILSDHEPFEGVQAFVKICKSLGAEFVVCTEKDFVKIRPEESAGVLPLELVVEVAYGKEEYYKMISAIKEKIEKKDDYERMG